MSGGIRRHGPGSLVTVRAAEPKSRSLQKRQEYPVWVTPQFERLAKTALVILAQMRQRDFFQLNPLILPILALRPIPKLVFSNGS